MTTIKFEAPTSETPGFLRRSRQALQLQQRLQAADADAIDSLIDFLLPFITEPSDPAEARDALLDASRQQFEQMLGAVTGGEPEKN